MRKKPVVTERSLWEWCWIGSWQERVGELQGSEEVLTAKPWQVSNRLFHHSANTVDVNKDRSVNSVAELLTFVIFCQLSHLFSVGAVFS